MGFWGTLGNGVLSVGKAVGNKLMEENDRIQDYRARYDRYDDDSLKREFRSASGARKIAIRMVLRDRGY